MKKIFTLLLTVLTSITASAQLSEGYYRVQNAYTGRYMLMNDQYGSRSGASVDLSAMQTVKPFSRIAAHPGSVVYVQNKGGNKYDLRAQATSLGSLSNGLYPEFIPAGGSYQIYAEYQGFAAYLRDPEDRDEDYGEVTINGGNNTVNWDFLPIGGDNYIGIAPEVQTADGTYWATFYCGFPYRLSGGMKAYYVNAVSESGFSLKEVSGDMPAAIPLLIKLNGGSASDNIVTPVGGGSFSHPQENQMSGVYYSSTEGGHHRDFNVVYSSSSHRILGKSGGELAFVTASSTDLVSGSYIEHNRCYLNVSSGSASTMLNATSGIKLIETEDATDNEVYTLSGQKIPTGTSLRPGIYIKDGKKVVIK